MYIKLFGAILIIAGCGGYGVMLAYSHRREVATLHQLADVLEKMICELEFRLTPLPELCRFAAGQSKGAVSTFFENLARVMEEQVAPDVAQCTVAALKATPGLSSGAAAQIQGLGQTLGRFDLAGQVTSLEHCKRSCLGELEVLEYQQSQRLRSYQTLGFCAGAALAILLF